MKIYVKSRSYVEKHLTEILDEYNIISIYSYIDSEKPFSPFKSDAENILKLQFDDATEDDLKYEEGIKLFDQSQAEHIVKFTLDRFEKDSKRNWLIHCDAGISRSGAVGTIMNEYFNKYLENNIIDNEAFKMNNTQILPNPLVARLLKNAYFGQTDYSIVFKNSDYDSKENEIKFKDIFI